MTTIFFRLDEFRPILYRFNDGVLHLSLGEKSLCVRVCVLRWRGDSIISYYSLKTFKFFSCFIFFSPYIASFYGLRMCFEGEGGLINFLLVLIFSAFVLSFLFGLIGFGQYYIGIVGAFCFS